MGLSRKIISSFLGRKIAIQASNILTKINKVIPKRTKKILFYSPESEFLTDNSKAIFNFLIENQYQKEYKIICCIPQKKSSKFIKLQNVKVVGFYSGILHFFTSGYVFYSFGSMRIKASKSQKVINLTHGTPLKSLGHLEVKRKYGQEAIDDFTYVISTSYYYKRIMSEVFQCNLEKVIIHGHARNDYLFSHKEVFIVNDDYYKKKILWMPTFRKLKGRYNDLGTKVPDNETFLPLLEKHKDLEEMNAF